jgi:glycosyltransferase involved in cell wall biosynthesis
MSTVMPSPGPAPASRKVAGMESPLFSIITPMYNVADVVGSAIRSAQAQTLGDFELIALDDGSSDGSAELVRELGHDDPRIRVEAQPNAGANAARNRAMAMARGRYITFLDSDDLKLPTYLETVHAALEANPNAGLAFTDAYILDDATRRIHRRTFMEAAGPYDPPPRDRVEFLEKLLETCFIPFSATTLRRSVIEEIGGFDPRLAGTDDYELWLRVLARGSGAVRAPGTLAVMRRRAGQISGDLPVMWRNLRQAYLLVADEFDIPESVRLRARSRADQLLPAIAEAERRAAEYRDMGPGGRALLAVWSLRMKVTWVRHWRVGLPEDVAAVFPDLRRR